MKSCPNCEFSNNAIETSQQRGIIVHDTHRSLVENNVLYNVRGSGIYIEDGNEMYNKIKYNVVICPFPLSYELGQSGCTIPGTDNDQADTSVNQAGVYTRAGTNDLIGNRAAQSFNGMLFEPGARGEATNQVCPNQVALGRWEGNTWHGHGRFGTYTLFGPYAKINSRSPENQNGHSSIDWSECDGFDADGNTRGIPAAIANNVDYDNVFVGHYEAGDIQYKNHASLNNLNLMYWKETKNFDDDCSAHITSSYYENGNVALPVINSRIPYRAY
eukprot:CAMPEP_0195289328 /NCGR_PEP_ID=MMETSP0707-20130614/5656_1 /TAXON_ID=33640 /ORGANISM="Asterionellopsis glacialis, Strain CCMP134" /LENGTH=272 /DNA_ID=CAMNT_0040349321 /DNA_START=168 /DNA_END=983 /DNA_ORIENTATION=+